MEKIKIIVMLLAFSFAGCKGYFVNEGQPDPVFEGNMWEFFRQDEENWGLFCQLVSRGGLEGLFCGSDAAYPQVTVFGLTNQSVYQFLLKTLDGDGERKYRQVGDIPEELCRRLVLSYVVAGRLEKDAFEYEVAGTMEGGTMVGTLGGQELRVYRTKSSAEGIPDIGPEGLYIHFTRTGHVARVISAGHVTDNGMVHALSTTFGMVMFE